MFYEIIDKDNQALVHIDKIVDVYPYVYDQRVFDNKGNASHKYEYRLCISSENKSLTCYFNDEKSLNKAYNDLKAAIAAAGRLINSENIERPAPTSQDLHEYLDKLMSKEESEQKNE